MLSIVRKSSNGNTMESWNVFACQYQKRQFHFHSNLSFTLSNENKFTSIFPLYVWHKSEINLRLFFGSWLYIQEGVLHIECDINVGKTQNVDPLLFYAMDYRSRKLDSTANMESICQRQTFTRHQTKQNSTRSHSLTLGFH